MLEAVLTAEARGHSGRRLLLLARHARYWRTAVAHLRRKGGRERKSRAISFLDRQRDTRCLTIFPTSCCATDASSG